jgi:hypothetical protein
VALAVIQEALYRDEFAIHIASFGDLQPRLEAINAAAVNDPSRTSEHPSSSSASPSSTTASSRPRPTFHQIRGQSLAEILIRNHVTLSHPPGVSGAIQSFRIANSSILGWKPSEYLASYQSCLEIFNSVKPSLAIVDPIFHFGVDACRTVGVRTVVLWPTLLKDVVITIQPYGAMLWKYPL